MAFFTIFTRNTRLDDFSCNITLKELADRLKSLYKEVKILDEDTIQVDCFYFLVNLRHRAGRPSFNVDIAIKIPENMIPSDNDLDNYLREMNEQFQAKVNSHKFEDATVLYFSYFVPNTNKMNIADINQIFTWLMFDASRGWNEFEKRFPGEKVKDKN